MPNKSSIMFGNISNIGKNANCDFIIGKLANIGKFAKHYGDDWLANHQKSSCLATRTARQFFLLLRGVNFILHDI